MGNWSEWKEINVVYHKQYSNKGKSAKILNIDITADYSDYANLTIDNIIVQLAKENGNTSGASTYTYTYADGIVTITTSKNRWSTSAAANNIVDIYILPDIDLVEL